MIYLKSYVIENDWAFGYETGRIAKSIASGEGFSSPFADSSGETAWLMPLYPLFLALIFKIFGIYSSTAAFAILTINCIISALTCIPIFHITKTTFGRNVGYIGAAALAFYPPSIWHAINTIWDTTLFTFLAMILLSWLLVLPQRFNRKNATLFGLFMGFVALVNAVIIAFLPFVLICLLLQPALPKKEKLIQTATICIATLVVLSPWLLRNYLVFGRPMLRSNFGVEFKLGNNPKAWNAYETSNGHLVAGWLLGHPSTDNDELITYKRFGEMEYVNRSYDDAMIFIRENPDKFLRLTLKRMSQFWISDLRTKNDWAGNLKISFSISELKKLFHILPIPFFVAGIILSFKNKISIAPLIGFIVFIPIVYYLTHISERYRYPVEPIVVVFACYALSSLIQLNKNRNIAKIG
jgi:4-amino-4-deoxy-L-arabinose transferase-like glycosyltransferase